MTSSVRPVPRLLLLGPLPPPYGGPEVMTKALLQGIAARCDLDVRHVNSQVSRSLSEKSLQGGKARKLVAALAQAARVCGLLATWRPEIVYLPLTNSPSFAGFLRDCFFFVPALLTGRKVVIRLHGGYYYYAHARGLRRLWAGLILGRVARAMVQGGALTNAFDGLVPAERIRVVPNGLDDAPFVAARQRLGPRRADGPLRVLFVGIHMAEKGVFDIIEAIPLVRRLVPGVEFLFAGEWRSPEDEARARRELAASGCEAYAHFLGVVTGDRKYDLFCSADVYVFPSYFPYEGHAVTSVEALAASLPIVCTDHGALGESVRDGWNGYFIPKQNPQAIADRLVEVLRDDTLRGAMGARSRLLYEMRFTLERFLDSWMSVIHEVAGQNERDVSSPSYR